MKTKQISKSFAFAFWLLLLAFLYQFFAKELSEQVNPNQNPDSYAQGDKRILHLQMNRYGHYVASGYINGSKVSFLLDTGATNVAIPAGVAEQIGLRGQRRIQVNTANGVTNAYVTKLDTLRIGEIQLYDLGAAIVPGMGGEQILLGMNVLKQLNFVQQGDTLTLVQQ